MNKLEMLIAECQENKIGEGLFLDPFTSTTNLYASNMKIGTYFTRGMKKNWFEGKVRRGSLLESWMLNHVKRMEEVDERFTGFKLNIEDPNDRQTLKEILKDDMNNLHNIAS